jgi:hypothetical protein
MQNNLELCLSRMSLDNIDINDHGKEPIINLVEKQLTLCEYVMSSGNHINSGVPNIYCRKYFDDEDFIYARMQLSSPCNTDPTTDLDINVINYITKYDTPINFADLTPDPQQLYVKILYIYQYINSYYTSLRCMRPNERLNHLPRDLLLWTENIVIILRHILDKDLYNFNNFFNNFSNKSIDVYDDELLFGLNLVVYHLKILINHCNKFCDNKYNISCLEEKYVKKIFRLINNICIIVIYFAVNSYSR